MLERLERYDWTAHAEREPQAGRMPRLLRRNLLGEGAERRRALHRIWGVLGGDDGYVMSRELVALTAIATVEAVPELDAEGRRRAARLLLVTTRDLWLNIYGEPGEEVVAALRDRLPQVRALLAEDVPDT